MGEIRTLIDHIGLLWTMSEGGEDDGAAARPLCGRDAMRAVGAIGEAAIAIDEAGRVAAVGPRKTVCDMAGPQTRIVDAEGGFACPGLVDPHTHLVHAGARERELPLRIAGAGYLDILRMGGGIMSTVRATRAASGDELCAQAARSLRRMRSYGVTAVEAKTGYGLELATERKQLETARRLQAEFSMEIAHTALPAHAIPPERRDDRDRFVRETIDMLPALQDAGAEFADVFVEDGVFTVEEGRAILLAAKALGMGVKIHADEMAPIGGAELAAELGAISADHLLAASDEGLSRMAAAGVTAVCLPGTSFYLQKAPARARFMIDEATLAVAVASDYNPGSSPSENFGLTMTLALLTLHLTPEEVFAAVTRNAACAMGRAGRAGVLRAGRPADIVLFHADNPAYVLTHYGVPHVRAVWSGGREVHTG